MGFILGFLLVELSLARLLGVSAVSPCLDPEDDSGSYKCLESTSTTSLILYGCALSDEDVEEGHLTSCFDAFGRDAMQTLRMYGSTSLTTLPEEIFEDLPALQELRIMYSSLTTLPVGIFQGLAGLDMLDLSFNDLTTLPDGIFQDLTNLYYLNLKYNGLTILPDGIQDMTAMELLYLGYNDLTTLPDGILQDLTALRWIHLGWNDLTTLPVELFQNAAALEYLQESWGALPGCGAGGDTSESHGPSLFECGLQRSDRPAGGGPRSHEPSLFISGRKFSYYIAGRHLPGSHGPSLFGPVQQ